MEKKKVTKKAAEEAAPVQSETKAVKRELTYDELKNYATQLSMQAQRMRQHITELEDLVNFKRLDYLFKVVEYPIQFPEDFVENCVKEIVSLMTPVQPEEETPEK